jgi:hypothetical protein
VSASADAERRRQMEHIRHFMEALGVGDKYKFESVIDGVTISYTVNGRKYLLTIKDYPYDR